MVAKLSSKGHLILPKAVRDGRSWGPGTQFEMEEFEGGLLLRPLRSFPPTRFEDVFGCLKYEGKPKTLAEMEEAIPKEVKRRHDSGRY